MNNSYENMKKQDEEKEGMQNVWSLVVAVCTTKFYIKKIYILIRHVPEERAIIFIYNIECFL